MGKYSDRFAPNIASIALHLLGQPDWRTSDQLRWGQKLGRVVNVSGSRAGTYHDFSTGNGGDAVALVMATLQLSFPDALAWLEKFTGPMNPTSDPISSRAIVRQQEWSSNADAIWNSATALRGTQGETYLRRRECYVAGATDLRYLKASGKYNSAILARVTDFLTGKPITLLFIDIDPFAGKLGVRFLSGHKKAGGVIRLVPCVNIGAPLGLAEGIETALTVIANGQGPVWSALDAGNLGALAVSPMFPVLNIWADNDPPGLKGAQTLADRWYLSGHNARVIAPPKSGQDWNDHIREKNSA